MGRYDLGVKGDRSVTGRLSRAGGLFWRWARAIIWLIWGDDWLLRKLRTDRRELQLELSGERETYPEAVFGWRRWIWDRHQLTLKSVSHVFPRPDGAWGPEAVPVRARCHLSPEHAAPVSLCSCGMYAYYLSSLPVSGSPPGGIVWGLVCGRGRVELHGEGWRAEEMQLLALRAAESSEELVDARLREYGVPLLSSQEEAWELARRYQPGAEPERSESAPAAQTGKSRSWILSSLLPTMVWLAAAAYLRVSVIWLPFLALGEPSGRLQLTLTWVSLVLWGYTLALRASGRDYPRYGKNHSAHAGRG